MTLSTRIAMMDAGRFMQIGTPTEIYEFPESRLVANFIGSANMFEGRVSENGLGRSSSGKNKSFKDAPRIKPAQSNERYHRRHRLSRETVHLPSEGQRRYGYRDYLTQSIKTKRRLAIA